MRLIIMYKINYLLINNYLDSITNILSFDKNIFQK